MLLNLMIIVSIANTKDRFSRDAFDCYLQKENESRKDFRANKAIEFESERVGKSMIRRSVKLNSEYGPKR